MTEKQMLVKAIALLVEVYNQLECYNDGLHKSGLCLDQRIVTFLNQCETTTRKAGN